MNSQVLSKGTVLQKCKLLLWLFCVFTWFNPVYLIWLSDYKPLPGNMETPIFPLSYLVIMRYQDSNVNSCFHVVLPEETEFRAQEPRSREAQRLGQAQLYKSLTVSYMFLTLHLPAALEWCLDAWDCVLYDVTPWTLSLLCHDAQDGSHMDWSVWTTLCSLVPEGFGKWDEPTFTWTQRVKVFGKAGDEVIGLYTGRWLCRGALNGSELPQSCVANSVPVGAGRVPKVMQPEIWRNIPQRDGKPGKELNHRLEIKPGGF